MNGDDVRRDYPLLYAESIGSDRSFEYRIELIKAFDEIDTWRELEDDA